MEVVLPCTNDDNMNCNAEGDTVAGGESALTDLRRVVLQAVRFGRPDTAYFGEIPAYGRECDTLRFDVQFDSTGAVYELLAWAEDRSGNRALCAFHCVVAVPQADFEPGLWGTYYPDTTFAVPIAGRADPNIDFNWGNVAAAPGVPLDKWGARWEGRIRTIGTGTYSFRAYINNGFRMWIGGQPVMVGDSWSNPNTHWSAATVTLNGGTEYPFLAEYRDACCEAFVHLYWTPPGGTEQVVPASAFVH
jgi:hypothetical protein